MLTITDLSVRYENSEKSCVLKNISLTLATGERVAMVGANGAGKSTLLLSLAGLLPYESGEVYIDGTRLENKTKRALRRKIGLLFQNPDDQLLMPDVYEDIAFGPRNFGISEAEVTAKTDEVLEEMGITHLKDRMTHKLSGGEKRLVALAGLLVMEPALLLMDEPTAFLDPRSARLLAAALNKLPQTMLIATHDRAFALAVCNRVVLIRDGEIRGDGSSDTVLADEELLLSCGL